MSGDLELDAILVKVRASGEALALTNNKKPEAAKNFSPVRGKPDTFDNGYWTSRPRQSNVGWGGHYEKGSREPHARVWIGRWSDASEYGDRWIYRLHDVEGPFQTRRTFRELFGVNPQPSFV